MNYFICGFMASGKSHLLKSLHDELGPETFKFFDLDNEILNRNSGYVSLSDLINSKGWEYFRNKESEVLKDLCSKKSPSIIALGGGTDFSAIDTRFLIWVDTEFETCYERIMKEAPSRPLAIEMTKEQLKKLYAERKQNYEKAKYRLIDPDNGEMSRLLKQMKLDV